MLNNRKVRTATLLATGAVAAGGMTMATAEHASADTSVWDRVAQCESGGNWSINTGNGYYGGLQFTLQTWHGYGGQGMPNQASKAEQIRIAQKVLAGQGPGAWPVCSVRAGLTRSNGGASGGSYTPQAPQQAPTTQAPSRSTTRQAVPQQRANQQAPKVKQYKHEQNRSTPKVQTTGETLTVKAGDTLSKLAQAHGLSDWQSLFAVNKDKISNPDLIFVGQVLNLPAA